MARVLGAAAGVALAALAPLTAVTPAGAATVYFESETTATAVHLVVTQQPASSIITRSLVDDSLGYATSDFDTGGASDALAAPAYPGDLVAGGPQLMCSELFSCPFTPPGYPLVADASYPRTTDDTAQLSQRPQGSGPLVVTPLNATAHAQADGNVAQTTAGAATLLAGTPAETTIGAIRAVTTTAGTADKLTVHVESVLHDVTIGGVVHIDVVRAVDDLTVVDGKRPVDHPSVTVAGVTVDGHAASIDDQGVHVDGTAGPSVTKRLAEQGVTIRTVGADRADTATGARSDVAALAIDLEVPVSGVPYVPNPVPPLPPPFDQIPRPGVDANGTYVGELTLGAVGAAGGVQQQPTFSLGGFVPPGSTAGGAGGAVAGGPVGGNQLVRSLAGGTPPSQPAVAAPPRSGLSGFGGGLSRVSLEVLYAVLALGTAALFVGWRGTVLIRRRG